MVEGRFAIEQAHFVTQGGGALGEFFEDGPFVGAIGEVNRAALVDPRAGLAGEFEPQAAAGERRRVTEAGRLADRPDHAEIADRRPFGLGRTVADDNRQTALGRGPGVGKTDDSGPDNNDISTLHAAIRVRQVLVVGLYQFGHSFAVQSCAKQRAFNRAR